VADPAAVPAPSSERPDPRTMVDAHPFRRRGWRFWICTHCYAPRSLHPRTGWRVSRPYGDNRYLSADAPHFKEGW
jgi:hypothetical protein